MHTTVVSSKDCSLKDHTACNGRIFLSLHCLICSFTGSKIYKSSFELNVVSELYPGWDANPAVRICNQPSFNTIECQVKDSSYNKDYTYAYIFYERGMIKKRTNPNKNLSTYSVYKRIRVPNINCVEGEDGSESEDREIRHGLK